METIVLFLTISAAVIVGYRLYKAGRAYYTAWLYNVGWRNVQWRYFVDEAGMFSALFLLAAAIAAVLS